MTARTSRTARTAKPPKAAIPTPYTVLIDSAEQIPFAFGQRLVVDGKAWAVQTARKPLYLSEGTLRKGDYSLAGFELPGVALGLPTPSIMIERKSLSDLYGTLGAGRADFADKLAMYARYTFVAIVVEAGWDRVLFDPPRRSKLNPRSVLGTIQAWQIRYPSIQWVMMPTREAAEGYVVTILHRFWREHGYG